MSRRKNDDKHTTYDGVDYVIRRAGSAKRRVKSAAVTAALAGLLVGGGAGTVTTVAINLDDLPACVEIDD